VGAAPGARANVDGLFAGVVRRGSRCASGSDGGNDCECHEESAFIYKATDLGELIGKLGKENFGNNIAD
jgi:hypothetical protein